MSETGDNCSELVRPCWQMLDENIRQNIQFVKTIPGFSSLTMRDQVRLIRGEWALGLFLFTTKACLRIVIAGVSCVLILFFFWGGVVCKNSQAYIYLYICMHVDIYIHMHTHSCCLITVQIIYCFIFIFTNQIQAY